MKAYKLLKDSTIDDRAKAGMVVTLSSHDYGLAADDTAMTGIKHVSVGLAGGAPFFTIPEQDLEPFELEPPSDEHVKTVCKPGSPETCRYLAMGGGGWSCEKLGSMADYINERVNKRTMNARGDNCEGKGSR